MTSPPRWTPGGPSSAEGSPRELAPPDLATLTGIRSGKRSYYRAYVRSDERLQQAVRSMDGISRALVRTVEGPRGLLEQVLRAAAYHLAADATILALSDGHLPGARPRFLALSSGRELHDTDEELPPYVRRELGAIRAGHALRSDDDGRWVRVPMLLDGEQVGSLVGLHQLETDPEPSDLSVLRILANQAAVSLHTSEQFQASLSLHRRAQRLYDEATVQRQDLEERTRELRHVEQRLVLAHQRELLDTERHRIARELHDTVSQHVLSAGMALELARGDLIDIGEPGRGVLDHVLTARQLSKQAVEQLRRAIYALHQDSRDTLSTLPELLADVAAQYRPHLKVQVRVEGEVCQLPVDADHGLARAVGEALFNVATHAEASRAIIRLRYRPNELMASVADDGSGDPTMLRRVLRLQRTHASGRHCGLANIESQILELDGRIAFRRARLGGVRIEMRVPLPLRRSGVNGVISGLLATDSSSSEQVESNS